MNTTTTTLQVREHSDFCVQLQTINNNITTYVSQRRTVQVKTLPKFTEYLQGNEIVQIVYYFKTANSWSRHRDPITQLTFPSLISSVHNWCSWFEDGDDTGYYLRNDDRDIITNQKLPPEVYPRLVI